MLNLQNPAEGKFYASIQDVVDDGTATYNGVLMSVQRRRGNGTQELFLDRARQELADATSNEAAP